MRLFEHGNFCWHDLMTPDMAAAKRFYGAVFGWSAEDMEMPQGIYVMFKLGEREVAGGMQITPEWGEVPPHWNTYVAVDDVDKTITHAQELGGQCCFGPENAHDIGRMAGIVDPQGAAISVWTERKSPHAPKEPPIPGTFCWDELLAKDTDAARAFYAPLFRWHPELADMPGMEYTLWKRGEEMLGGMMAIAPEMGPIPSNWMPYVTVADCDGAASRAQQLGATILVPPTNIPTVGRFAVVADPQGAVFSVLAFPS